MPLGVGDGFAHAGGGDRASGGTALVVAAGLIQLLGFALPVVIATTAGVGAGVGGVVGVGAEAAAGAAYEFRWSYESFSLQSPGLAELAFFLPVTGILTLIAAFLPTRFLRPALLTVIGAVSMFLLYRNPEVHTQLLQRLPYLGWEVVAAAFAACMLIGIVFGLAPAWTAAKSQPIDALRYE